MKPIAFYLVGTGVLTFLLQLHIIGDIQTTHTLLTIPLTWIPGLVAVACSAYLGFGFKDLALIKPGRRSLVYAYTIPATIAVLSLLILVILRIGDLTWPGGGIVRPLLVEPTLGVLAGIFLAAGEELGWRGYLHTHLLRARVRHPVIITGFLWAVWQWPLVFFTERSLSSLPFLNMILFTITTVSFSVFLAWLRERSRSVGPAILAHAVHNSWVLIVCPSLYKPGRLDPFFNGESGFVLAILYLLIAMYLYRRHPMGRYVK